MGRRKPMKLILTEQREEISQENNPQFWNQLQRVLLLELLERGGISQLVYDCIIKKDLEQRLSPDKENLP